MAALIKFATPGKACGVLGIDPTSSSIVQVTRDGMGARLPAGEVLRIGGKQDGIPPADDTVEANQHVIIASAVSLRPPKYNVQVSYNPDLLLYGTVSTPTYLSAGFSGPALLHFHATKKVDLNEFPYIFEFYLVD